MLRKWVAWQDVRLFPWGNRTMPQRKCSMGCVDGIRGCSLISWGKQNAGVPQLKYHMGFVGGRLNRRSVHGHCGGRRCDHDDCVGIRKFKPGKTFDPGRWKQKGTEVLPKNRTVLCVHFSPLRLTLTLPIRTLRVIKKNKERNRVYSYTSLLLLFFLVYNTPPGPHTYVHMLTLIHSYKYTIYMYTHTCMHARIVTSMDGYKHKHIHMYTYTHILTNVHMYAHTHTPSKIHARMPYTYGHTHALPYACTHTTHIRTHSHVHAYTHKGTHRGTQAHAHEYTQTRKYIRRRTYSHAHVSTYIRMYTRTHIHAYTRTHARSTNICTQIYIYIYIYICLFRDELIRDVLLWTPTHGRAKAGRPARTYIQQLCEDTGCCPEDLPRAMNDREEWRERFRDIRATSVIWWWWWYISSKYDLYISSKYELWISKEWMLNARLFDT